MAQVRDVAQFILERLGPLTTMKLQKLVYYCQAWNIAWKDDVLFPSQIQAWADGPVAPDLFRLHRGIFRIDSLAVAGADSRRLTAEDRDTIERVIQFYGDKSPQWLINLTHQEAPWREARAGVPDGASCDREITPAAMGAFYSSL